MHHRGDRCIVPIQVMGTINLSLKSIAAKKEIIFKILKKYHYEIVDKKNSENNNHEGRQSY